MSMSTGNRGTSVIYLHFYNPLSCDILNDLFQTSVNSFCICFSSGKLVPRLAPRLTVAGLIPNFQATSAQPIISLQTAR